MKLIPKLRDGAFEFMRTRGAPNVPKNAAAMIMEDEDMTLVMPTDEVDEYSFAWISLVQETSLHATGITKAFSAALSDAGIPCNVLAGFKHDHILVPYALKEMAMEIIAKVEVK